MMQANGLDPTHRFLRTVGSLWFAAVLLSLLLLAMACATVFESANGTEQTLATFYHAWWFKALLALLAINILATMVVRYPFSRRQVGFVVTHASILLIFAGAWVTAYWGVNGSLGIVEGQSEHMVRVDGTSLTVMDTQSGRSDSLDLDSAIGSGFEARTLPALSLALGDVRIQVNQYLPDTVVRDTVTNDAPHSHPAVQVTLADEQENETVWLFAGEPGALGPVKAAYRVLDSDEQLAELALPDEPDQSGSIGSVRISVEGVLHEIPVERCMAQAEAVGDTGITAKVLRYLPHATVAAEGKLVNASPQPMNPAIEVELRQGEVTETRLAFARFPDFASMHSKQQLMDVKVRFDFSAPATASVPLQILSSPSGGLHVRFAPEGGNPLVREIRPGESIETPWSNRRLTVVQVFDRARSGREVVAAETIRETRIPAVRVSITAGDEPVRNQWVRRGYTTRVVAGGSPLEMVFGDTLLPLDFDVKLERFRVGYYPGTQRPRSFESRVSITDATTGLTQGRVISMNHPTKYGGYTFYQSSYRLEPNRTVSFLSVARDPGQWIVFAGYIGVLVGMLWVLALRVKAQRESQAGSPGAFQAAKAPETNSQTVSLITESPVCLNSSGQVQSIGGTPRPVPPAQNLGRKGGRKQCT